MRMFFSLEPCLTIQQRIALKQTLAKKQALRLTMRAQVLHALRGYNYVPDPRSRCDTCQHILSVADILFGFCDSPTDRNVQCRYCGHKNNLVTLVNPSAAGKAEVPFYCAEQVLHFFQEHSELAQLRPQYIEQQHPGFAHSAIVHFGNFKELFAKIGITYKYGKLPDWVERVRDFFGKVPDTIIAECVGVSYQEARRVRNKLKIPSWKPSTKTSS